MNLRICYLGKLSMMNGRLFHEKYKLNVYYCKLRIIQFQIIFIILLFWRHTNLLTMFKLKTMKKILLLSAFFFILIFFSKAQQKTVEGTVVQKENGFPIPGVTVVEQGTTNGTITDLDGQYNIEVPPEAILVFSSVGMQKREIKVGDKTTINVTLEKEEVQIDEIVVVGYGTKRKRDVIGSVAKVQSAEMEEGTELSIDNALQGRAAGVQVTSSSGVPGAPVEVKVRGINSISIDTDPLWVIDGMPIYSGKGFEFSQGTTGQNPLSMINSKDIETIEVLKGAAATAIYGSRGANGVILVTTKAGRGEAGKLSVDYSTGLSELTKTLEDMGYTNTPEYFQLADIAIQNATGNPADFFTPGKVLNTRPTFSSMSREQALRIQTDWMDEVIRTGQYHDLNVSNTASYDKGSAFISFGYRHDKSVNVNNDLQRFTGRINADIEPVKNFTTGVKISFSYSDNDRVKSEQAGAIGTGGGKKGGFSTATRGALPWFPIYDASDQTGYWSPASGVNLTAGLDRKNILDKVKQYRSIGGIFADFKLPVEGWSVRGEVSYDYIQNNSELWVAAALREEENTFAHDRATTYQGINYNVYTSFDRTIGDHYFNAVVGTESHLKSRHERNMEGMDLIGQYQELGNPQTRLEMTSNFKDERYLRAYFSRATYKFKDRYLIGFSFRSDGSSKFDEDYRWANFPAVKAGWIISDEPFLSSVKAFNILKIRGSYGVTGNQSIPDSRFYTIMKNDADNRYSYQNLSGAGTKITNIGNPFLTWETTREFEAGLDYGLLNNRINGSLAYYYQSVFDLLLQSEIPPSTGLEGSNKFWENIGDMHNYGFEFDISSVNIHKKSIDFRWSTSFNFTWNDNMVDNLTPSIDRSGKGMTNGDRLIRSGNQLNTWYLAEFAGIDPEKGVEMIYEIDYDHYLETGETVKTGRKIPATLSNVSKHKVILEGKTDIPKYYGGLTNTFSYKGFDLSFQINYSGGNYVYDYNLQRTSFVHNGQNLIKNELLTEAWSEDNRESAKYPRIVWNSFDNYGWDPDANDGEGAWTEGPGAGNYTPEQRKYSKFLFKADYVRLKNLRLGYTVPQKYSQRIKVKKFRVYVSATNLLTLTDYPGYDPETSNHEIVSVPLPHLKIYSLGIRLIL